MFSLLEKVKNDGITMYDRIILFGEQFEMNLNNEFPIFDVNFDYLVDKVLEMDVCPSKLESIFILQDFSLNPTLEHFQLNVANSILSGKLYVKHCDVVNRLPVTIALYSLLLNMIAHMLGYKVGKLICTFGNTYILHKDMDKEYKLDSPKQLHFIKRCENFKDFTSDHIRLSLI